MTIAHIVISSKPVALQDALAPFHSTATVEAEYGTTVVPGSVLTLAHHGERSARPCPCLTPNLPDLDINVIGISHVDLDTLGGIMSIMGIRPDGSSEVFAWHADFWKAAAFVDINGVHKLTDEHFFGDAAPQKVRTALMAFWAYSEEHRVFAPRDGSAKIVDLNEYFKVIHTLLYGKACHIDMALDYDKLIEAGEAWAAAKDKLEEDSFYSNIELANTVIVRSSDSFVNHLYNHGTITAKAVVGYNTTTCGITISLADPIDGVSCSAFMKEQFGELAGGHAGIAGTPRGEKYTICDAMKIATLFSKLIA